MMPMDSHHLECDVLVAGGGPAGVACAIAAARCGAKVVLCQDRSVLGGNASSEVRMHVVGADRSGKRGTALQTEAREGGIIEEIRIETAVRNPQRSASMLDLILYEMCVAEPNLELMLNTTVTGVEMGDEVITHVFAVRQSTEDQFRIAAKVFCDCTGDGRLGAEAHAPFREGREGSDEYKESLAQSDRDDKRLGSTLLLQARRHDKPMPFVSPPWVRKFTEDDLRLRPHGGSGVDSGFEYGYWWVELGGDLDTIKDNETIRDELLAALLGVWDHIKNSVEHDAANWALDWFGFLPGKRESRRFVGQHVLRQSDMEDSRTFDDAIAFGGWPIDIHPPGGIDSPDLPPATPTGLEYLYAIPLRSCVAQTPRNLMFAGRNISATHVAFASTRVMATCAVVGQGVGTAAAYAVANGINPSELSENKHAIQAIQQRLLRDDSYLVGVSNEDRADIAPLAQISASSEQLVGAAVNVVSGQTRAAEGPGGAPPGRSLPGTNRWMSGPVDGLPASIEFRWPKPVQIGEIQLVFDTGMHRVLTLSHSDDYVAMMDWGRAQPETVRDYVVEGIRGGARWELARVAGNYQRLNRHAVGEAPEVDAVRITVAETNGIDHARICEVRIYATQPP